MTDETSGEDQPEQHRDAEAVDQPRDHVAALVVGAEPVVFEVAAALRPLALDHRLAFLLGQHPGRLRRRRRRQVEIVRVVGIADRRPDHVAALLRDQLLQIGIAIVGRGLEVAAEGRLRIGDERRENRLAVVADEERLVVGDELGEQRDDEQDQEDPERPVAAPVGLEILPAPPVDRRQRRAAAAPAARRARPATTAAVSGGPAERARPPHTSRVSKSMRGSIQV